MFYTDTFNLPKPNLPSQLFLQALYLCDSHSKRPNMHKNNGIDRTLISFTCGIDFTWTSWQTHVIAVNCLKCSTLYLKRAVCSTRLYVLASVHPRKFIIRSASITSRSVWLISDRISGGSYANMMTDWQASQQVNSCDCPGAMDQFYWFLSWIDRTVWSGTASRMTWLSSKISSCTASSSVPKAFIYPI